MTTEHEANREAHEKACIEMKRAIRNINEIYRKRTGHKPGRSDCHAAFVHAMSQFTFHHEDGCEAPVQEKPAIQIRERAVA